jgi:hypothetical protein
MKLLEPSGPVQACNGIALTLIFTFTLGIQLLKNVEKKAAVNGALSEFVWR